MRWRSLFRQLIAQGFLGHIDLGGHGVLRLTSGVAAVLRGEQSLTLRGGRKPDKEKPKRSGKLLELRHCDQPLFESLRALRLQLAEQQGVPPYVIFHDATLSEMAPRGNHRHRPGEAGQLWRGGAGSGRRHRAPT